MRDKARELGACRILGNRMVFTQSDIELILETTWPCPSKSTSAARRGTTGTRFPGRQLHGTTGAANKEAAARIESNIEAREWKRNLDGPEAVLTFAQAAMLYRAAGKPTRFLEKIEEPLEGHAGKGYDARRYPQLSNRDLPRRAGMRTVVAGL